MQSEIVWVLYRQTRPFALESWSAALADRGYSTELQEDSLRVTSPASPEQVFTLGDRSAEATVAWICRGLLESGTKADSRRAAAIGAKAFDACVQIHVSSLETVKADEGALVDLMDAVQGMTGGWIYLRWNRRWIFSHGEKVPAVLR